MLMMQDPEEPIQDQLSHSNEDHHLLNGPIDAQSSQRQLPFSRFEKQSSGMDGRKRQLVLTGILGLVVIITLVILIRVKHRTDSMIGTVGKNRSTIDSYDRDIEEIREKTKVIKQVSEIMERAGQNDKLSVETLTRRMKSLQNKIIKAQKEGQSRQKLSIASATVDLKDFKKNLQRTIVSVQQMYIGYRQKFFKKKMQFFDKLLTQKYFRVHPHAKNALLQAGLNYESGFSHHHSETAAKVAADLQYERLSKQYPFQEDQLPFCFLVNTRNNAQDFRYEYNLRSIYNLYYDHQKIRVVITDDASTDHTSELIKNYLGQHPTLINFTLIRNNQTLTPLANSHQAITQYCKEDQIIIFLDGRDELLNPYSLQVFNSVYQSTKADVVYSDPLEINWDQKQVVKGLPVVYSQQVRDNNTYRQSGQRISHLVSFRAKLYKKIKEGDLKDSSGKWFTSNYNDAIFYPILQLSCGRIEYLQEEYFYLKNVDTKVSDKEDQEHQTSQIINYDRFQKPKYQCKNKSDQAPTIRK